MDKDQMNKNMTWKQKLGYFKDYYLFHTLCIAAAAAVGILLIWHFLLRDDEVALYVAVVNESLETEDEEKLRVNLGQALGLDADDIMVDDGFYLEGDGLNKLEIYLKNSQIDVLIADREDYELLCGFGFLKDLRQVCDSGVLEGCREQLVYAAGYLESEEISFEDHETGQGERLTYGFDMAGTDFCSSICNALENPVIGVAENTKHADMAVRCIRWLLGEETVDPS